MPKVTIVKPAVAIRVTLYIGKAGSEVAGGAGGRCIASDAMKRLELMLKRSGDLLEISLNWYASRLRRGTYAGRARERAALRDEKRPPLGGSGA
jgi:hypothetical protein